MKLPTNAYRPLPAPEMKTGKSVNHAPAEKPWLACCPLAVAFSCVCVAAYDCPAHGKMHVGSHD